MLVRRAGGVTSISNSNGTLTISPTTGAVVASLNLGNVNTWTALQDFRGAASTTRLSVLDKLFIGTNSTTTIQGESDGTSTDRINDHSCHFYRHHDQNFRHDYSHYSNNNHY